MPRIHFLNVNKGDCIVLEHNSGRVTIFDISAGNLERKRAATMEAIARGDISPRKVTIECVNIQRIHSTT